MNPLLLLTASRPIIRWTLASSLVVAAACGSSSSSSVDGAGPDQEQPRRQPDATVDTSEDAVVPDIGPPPDSGPPTDGQPADGQPGDSQPPDQAPAGDSTIDSGPAPDSTIDSGPPPDSTIDAVTPPDGPPPPPVGSAIVDIRADTNRDGVVSLDDPTEDADEDTWDQTHGAVFLANIDDDDQSCPKLSSSLSDSALAACHDGANETIDGASDLDDLARLKIAPWPGAPNGTIGEIVLSLPIGTGSDPRSYVRLFRDTGGGSFAVFGGSHTISASELRQGVELAIEGRDIIRDTTKWDGYLDVILKVTFVDDQGQTQSLNDKLRMRIAPLLTSHHLQDTERVLVTGTSGTSSSLFRTEIGAVVTAVTVPDGLTEIGTNDQWTQDFLETGWISMPAAGGAQHGIKVYIRSANIEAPNDPKAPLRYAGRAVYLFRGPDVGAVQQYDLSHPGQMDTLNSLGNLETIPPYSHGGKSYPMGRMMMGKTQAFYPSTSFTKMLEAQAVQPPVWIDTSWLSVGHVDETISFIPAKTPRGWALLLNDAAMAKKMLEDKKAAGHGAVKMFIGKNWLGKFNQPISAEVSIDEVLADPEVMADSAQAVIEVASQLAVLKQETGITDAEIVPVPFLHYTSGGYSVAYQPGTINSILIGLADFAAPDPHGPVIDGADIFKKQLTDALAPYGVTVHYIEDWDLYHRLLGEVHCGTNSQRALPSAKWWESGR